MRWLVPFSFDIAHSSGLEEVTNMVRFLHTADWQLVMEIGKESGYKENYSKAAVSKW